VTGKVAGQCAGRVFVSIVASGMAFKVYTATIPVGIRCMLPNALHVYLLVYEIYDSDVARRESTLHAKASPVADMHSLNTTTICIYLLSLFVTNNTNAIAT
jgi:hypothetical protein